VSSSLKEKAKEAEESAKRLDGAGNFEARDRALQREAILLAGDAIASELHLIFGLMRNYA
jgi:hypothetical protein